MNLDAIGNLVSSVGMAGRDPTTFGTVQRVRERLDEQQLRILYEEHDLCTRIVDEIVDDALRAGYEVRSKATGDVLDVDGLPFDATPFVEAASKAGRLFGTAALLVVPDIASPTQRAAAFRTSTPQQVNARLASVFVVERDELSAVEYEDDLRSPNYGRPRVWAVAPATQAASHSLHVRAEWLCFFHGQKLPRRSREENQDFDLPVLQSVWKVVRNFILAETAIAGLLQRYETATFRVKGLADIVAGGDADENYAADELLRRRLEILQLGASMYQAAIIDADGEEDYSRAFASLNGLDTLWDRLAHSVAKAARMPMTQLFGMAPSGLATDDNSGRANWAKQVASYQKLQLAPALRTVYGLLFGEEVEIHWPPLDEATSAEKAQTYKTRSEGDAIYIKHGILSAEEVRANLIDAGIIHPGKEGDEAPSAPAPSLYEETTNTLFDPTLRADSAEEAEAWVETYREDEELYDVPEAARNNARKFLRWVEEHGDEVKGATRVGRLRARQLAERGKVSRNVLGRMAAFARHKANAEVDPKYKSEPWRDNGYVAWLAWGGTAGINWAASILDAE